ncbi:unnamed protein product [Didymodactylos carnosus]|uniref:Amidohydrolase-related domain-containing protein n=1 Tax=Didymodactylos carnosus TaxID=1234261 RepID=A0A814YQV2_9BILA|nr:unnamed protein product [Didymodactylos carnosus]CAF1370407.1 unnamed protein product [Didymodactylos carnosus]CAF3994974.1 unnamed protein product [Didymodactylos carnosus]CAF4179574.1 unnamed protein product [Didymodactylos carnosus]
MNSNEYRIIIENGIVLTLDDADTVYFPGIVVIENDRITHVIQGSSFEGARRDSDVFIDASRKLVMPGLVDLHYHTAIAKGWNDHMPLWEYLDACWYPAIRALDDDASYWSALASYSESIKCGTTTVNDMYRKLDGVAKAAKEIGIRAVLCNDVALAEHNLDSLQDNIDTFHRHHNTAEGRIEVRLGIEWLPLSSPEQLRETRQLANELGIGIHIHLNESLTEVEDSVKRFGKRPTEVAYEAGLLGPDCIAAHCVHLDDHEISLMARTGTNISHNPVSNAKLGNGIARLPEMLAAGLNIGLGHDAAECNNSRDMFEVMKFASLIHRASRKDASLGQAPDIVRMATKNGSKALRHSTGQLIPGYKADIILINLNDVVFTPLKPDSVAQLLSHLVFAANGSCVNTTIINGQIVMRDRKLLTVDENLVVTEANKAFLRILKQME